MSKLIILVLIVMSISGCVTLSDVRAVAHDVMTSGVERHLD